MRKQRLIILITFFVLAITAMAQVESDKEVTLDEVVITGTGTEHLLKNAPVQTEVISGKQLRNYGARSIEDILGMLSASFDFSESDMGSRMQINGLGNSYILILIDGKRIHGDNGGENDLGLIDPQNIDHIEIVKGASSALYGSDAIAGVVNIITKKRSEGMLIENSTRVGSYGDVRQHNGLGLTLGKLQSFTNFQWQHSDGWQNTSVEDIHQTEFLITDSRNKTVNRHTNWQISERLTYQADNNLQLYADGSFYWKRIYRPSGKYASTDVHTYDLMYRNASAGAGAKLNLSKTDYITFDVNWNRHAYYYLFTDTTLTDGYYKGKLTHYYPYFPTQQLLQSDQQRTIAELKGVFYVPYNNRLSAGMEYRYDWLKAPVRVKGGRASANHQAIYVQDEFDMIRWINISAGLRLNHNHMFGFRLTPKLSAMIHTGERFRWRATWSQGFKVPTIKEMYYQYVRKMVGTYLYLGNTELKPQTSNYFSLGGEYNGHGLSITLTAYHNSVDNMITLVTIPKSEAPGEYIVEYDPIAVRQFRNVEDAKTMGIDFTARYRIREVSMGMGYSYLNTRANIYDTEENTLKRVVIDGMARHKANLFATWNHRFTPGYAFGIGLYAKMSSKRYYQINGDGKGYNIWRINTTHDFGRSKSMGYSLEAGIDNIFNYVDRTPHGLHLGTTTPGTTIYAKFTIKFSKGKRTSNKFNSNLKQNYYDEED